MAWGWHVLNSYSALKLTRLIKVDLGPGLCGSKVHALSTVPLAKVILAKEAASLPILSSLGRRRWRKDPMVKTMHLRKEIAPLPTCLPLGAFLGARLFEFHVHLRAWRGAMTECREPLSLCREKFLFECVYVLLIFILQSWSPGRRLSRERVALGN